MKLVHAQTPIAPDRATLAADATDASGPVWNQLALLGDYRGYARGKQPFSFTAATFGDIVQNFHASQNKRVPVDFAHLTEADPTMGDLPLTGAPAQAWILDVKIGQDGHLWGLIDWLDPARSQVREGRFAWFSVAVELDAVDMKSGRHVGARLTSCAITNRPAIDGLQRLVASDATRDAAHASTHEAEMTLNDDDLQPFRSALGLPDKADAGKCLLTLAGLQDLEPASPQRRSAEKALRLHLHLPLHAQWGDVRQSAETVIRRLSAPPATTTMRVDADGITITNSSDAITASASTGETIMDPNVKLLADKDTQIASVTVKLTAVEQEAAKLRGDLDAANKKIVALEAEVEKRVTAETEAFVDALMQDHGIPADRRGAFVALARADRAQLMVAFPLKTKDQRQAGQPPAHQRYLTDFVAAGRNGEAPATIAPDGVGGRRVDLSEDLPTHLELQNKYLEKGLSLEDANDKAHRKIQSMLKDRARKAQNGVST